jgi:hydroxymethylpyrimidine/phosphomethylpyrimidine kinase
LPISNFGLQKSDLEYEPGEAELKAEGRKAVDFMFDGNEEFIFTADFIETTATHGTGCTFAAAITANLANGKTLREAIESAKRFVTEAIRTAPHLGRGHSPINISTR